MKRMCNETSSSPDYSTNDIKKSLNTRLDSFDEILREEMAETRIAVSDQASHLKKLSQVIFQSV